MCNSYLIILEESFRKAILTALTALKQGAMITHYNFVANAAGSSQATVLSTSDV